MSQTRKIAAILWLTRKLLRHSIVISDNASSCCLPSLFALGLGALVCLGGEGSGRSLLIESPA